LWILYLETPVGQRFLADHIVYVGVIENLQRQNFLILTLRVALIVIAVCLVLGAAGRVLLVMRYIYDPQGFFGHLIFWGIPSAVLTSFAIHRTLKLGWAVSFSLGLLPTLLLFNYCFRFTLGLVPEISTVFGSIVSLTKKVLERFTTVEPETNGSSKPRHKVDYSVAHYGPERRSELRHKVDFSIIYYGPEGNAIDESMAFQVSNRGFCLWQPKDVVTGDTIKFELRVENALILGEAQIKWAINPSIADENKALPSRAGCHIISMYKKYESVLRSYLNRHFAQEKKRDVVD